MYLYLYPYLCCFAGIWSLFFSFWSAKNGTERIIDSFLLISDIPKGSMSSRLNWRRKGIYWNWLMLFSLTPKMMHTIEN